VSGGNDARSLSAGIALGAFEQAYCTQHQTFLRLGGTKNYFQLHAIPKIQLLLELDPYWWSCVAFYVEFVVLFVGR
jgi:hypothetical protein